MSRGREPRPLNRANRIIEGGNRRRVVGETSPSAEAAYGQTLYANIGIEKAVPNGAVVHYYLARLELADKKLELLCHLKDIRF